VRFSCERCGKKYAAADPPAPGKIYKLKCKACGHLIVVRAGPSTSAGPPVQPRPGGAGTAAPAAIGGSADAPLAPPPGTVAGPRNGASASAAQVPGEETSPATLEAASPPPERRPAPGDSGWVDLFSDLTPAEDREDAAAEDALLAAARNSLPESYGSGGRAPNPLGAPAAERAARRAGASSAARAAIPKPLPPRSGLPIALIAGGVAVVAGILAFVLLRSGPRAAAPPPQRAAQAQALPAPPSAMSAPAQAPAPAPPPAEALPPAAPAERVGEGLTQAQIESALRSARKRFEACLQDARGTDPRLDGRRVTLRLDVQPSGAVTHPTLDDASLAATDLGSCLKGAARHAAFPRFEGDALRLDVPIVLR
jgi:DNA-directed RNA polymerase subunit RPC12/RpoP